MISDIKALTFDTFGTVVEDALMVGVGGSDAMDFHALEAMQSVLERRRGGETGVRRVDMIQGDAVWRARDAGRWSRDLLAAALSRSDSLQGLSARDGRPQALAEGDEIVGVRPAPDAGLLVVVTKESHALVCKLEEVNVLANPGRGVTVIKVKDDDQVLGFTVDETLTVESEKGKTEEIKALKKEIVSRGGKGNQIWRKDQVAKIIQPPVVVPQLAPESGDKN